MRASFTLCPAMLLAAVVLWGCAAPTPEPVAWWAEAIGNADGADSNATGDRYPSVVFVQSSGVATSDGSTLLARCSGVLISPVHVLTAAHCFDDMRFPTISVRFGAEQTTVGVTSPRQPPLLTRSVAQCWVNPNGFDLEEDETEPLRCSERRSGVVNVFPHDVIPTPRTHHDVAILHLSAPVPLAWASTAEPGFNPHRIIEVSEEPSGGWLGSDFDLVGYGVTTLSTSPTEIDQNTLGIRRFVNAELVSLTWPSAVPGSPPQPFDEPFLMFDGFAVVGETGGSAALPSDYHGSLLGDSGGPAIWADAPFEPGRGAPVVGIASTFNAYASLLYPPNRDFIERVVDPDGDGRIAYGCFSSESVRLAAYDPNATPSTDTDGDGVLNTRDNCATTFNPCQQDQDIDGVGDACDSCPRHPNSGIGQTLDADGDGIPNACDGCPELAGPGAIADDLDGDGVWNACDNCIDVRNADQANCNEDAERLYGLLRGDACDEFSPCADTVLQPRLVRTSPVHYVESNDATFGSGIASDALAGAIRTGFRFCPCDVSDIVDTVEARDACRLMFDCAVDENGYAGGVGFWVAPDMALPYETDIGSPSGALEFSTPYRPGALGDRTESFWGTWSSLDDAVALGIEVPVPFGSEYRGVFWTHSSEYVATDDGVEASGLCEPEVDCPILDRTLASHYWSGVLYTRSEYEFPDETARGIVVDLFPQWLCPECFGSFPIPALAQCGTEICLRRRAWDGVSLETTVIDAPPLQSLPTEVVDALLDPSLTWIAAAEPRGALGRDAMVAVAVRQTTREVVAGLLVDATLVAPAAPITLNADQFWVLRGNSGTLHGVGGEMMTSIRVVSGEHSLAYHEADDIPATVVAATVDVEHGGIVALSRSGSFMHLFYVELDRSFEGRPLGYSFVLQHAPAGTNDTFALSAREDGRVVLAGWQNGEPGVDVVLMSLEPWHRDAVALRSGHFSEHVLGDVRADRLGISFRGVELGGLEWAPRGISYGALGEPAVFADAL